MLSNHDDSLRIFWALQLLLPLYDAPDGAPGSSWRKWEGCFCSELLPKAKSSWVIMMLLNFWLYVFFVRISKLDEDRWRTSISLPPLSLTSLVTLTFLLLSLQHKSTYAYMKKQMPQWSPAFQFCKEQGHEFSFELNSETMWEYQHHVGFLFHVIIMEEAILEVHLHMVPSQTLMSVWITGRPVKNADSESVILLPGLWACISKSSGVVWRLLVCSPCLENQSSLRVQMKKRSHRH